ncbi:MAG TPA: DUF4412 domain-containing protein [Cyclobacteriaceae bacterium]|jgi:hypothetical protein|nr:DUF4412 domain-containing protein [Cyclobacteriaceae bacterium]
MRTIQIIALLSIAVTTSVTYGQSSSYLEYGMRIKGTDEKVGRLLAYFNNGNSINEITYNNSGSSPLDLILKDSLNMTYRLSSNKTYIQMPDPQLAKYKINYLRDEKVDTLNCKVIKVATHNASNFDIVLWITNQIVNYDAFMMGSVNSIDFVKLKKALIKQNISGIPIVIQYEGSEESYEYVLKGFGNSVIDFSLFSLDGYTLQKLKSVDDLYKEGKVNEEQMKAMKEEEQRIMKQNKK